jgi:hypothetical protein
MPGFSSGKSLIPDLARAQLVRRASEHLTTLQHAKQEVARGRDGVAQPEGPGAIAAEFRLDDAESHTAEIDSIEES